MSKKAYELILKVGAYLALVPSFFVFKNLLFPFITSKQIPFNILIEILIIFWVAYIFKFPKERPKWNYITYGLIGFFAVMVLTCFTGVDFNLSFWGDVERMLGAFHVLHFFGLYLIMITVFKKWRDWKLFFLLSVVTTTFISLNGITGEKEYSTIGNVAYIAGLIIFNLYFALLLFIKEKPGLMRWLYAIPVWIMIQEFIEIDITGGFVGLAFSVLVLFFLYGLLYPNKKVKTATMVIFLLGTFFVTYFFIFNRDNFLTRNFKAWDSLTRQVNVQKNTFQTRLVSWRTALKDYKHHPILGTGYGNFAITFDKYFEPEFYNYTRSETYFDRAHNNVVDIITTTGTVGLISYLLIFAAILYYLIRGFVQKRIDVHNFAIVSAVISGYFVQNLAVFDSYVTYIALMSVLGYVYWLYHREIEVEGEEANPNFVWDAPDYAIMGGVLFLSLIALGQDSIQYFNQNPTRLMWFNLLALFGFIGAVYYFNYKKWATDKEKNAEVDNRQLVAVSLVALISIVLIWQYNIKPLRMLITTIDAQRYLAVGNIDKCYESYKKALAIRTVLDRDSRTSMIRVFANGNNLKKLKNYTPQEVIDFTISHAIKNVEYNPGDSMNQMTLAQIYNTAATAYPKDSEKYNEYWDKAMETIDLAIAASPGRIPVYYQKAQFYITRNDKESAIEVLKSVEPLNTDYFDTYCHLGRTYLHYGDIENGFKYIDECIDKGGQQILSSAESKRYLEHYKELGDKDRLIVLYRVITAQDKKDDKNFIELAKLYAETGDNERAIEAAEKAKEINPSIAEYVDKFIGELE